MLRNLLLPLLLLVFSETACSQAEVQSEVKRQKTRNCTEMLTNSIVYTLYLPIRVTQKALTKSTQIAAFIGKSLMAFRSRSTTPTLDQEVNQVFQETGTRRQLPTSKRQKEIASFLCSNTELPYELIRLIIVYDDPFLFHQPSHAITALAVLTPSNHLASASGDMSIQIWDPNTGECLIKLQRDLPITTMASLPNNELACYEDRSFIHIWNTTTGKQRITLKDEDPREEFVNSILALPNEKLASGGYFYQKNEDSSLRQKGIIKIWNTKSGEAHRTFEFNHSIRGLHSYQNSDNIIVKTYLTWKINPKSQMSRVDPQTFLFNPTTGQISRPIIQEPYNFSSCIFLAPCLIAAGDSKNIYKYDSADSSYQTYSPFWIASLSSFPIRLALLSNKKIASAGWRDQKVRILDPQTLECKQEYRTDRQITALTELADNKFAIGSSNGKIEVIDTTPEKDEKKS